MWCKLCDWGRGEGAEGGGGVEGSYGEVDEWLPGGVILAGPVSAPQPWSRSGSTRASFWRQKTGIFESSVSRREEDCGYGGGNGLIHLIRRKATNIPGMLSTWSYENCLAGVCRDAWRPCGHRGTTAQNNPHNTVNHPRTPRLHVCCAHFSIPSRQRSCGSFW